MAQMDSKEEEDPKAQLCRAYMPQEFGHQYCYSFEERKEKRFFSSKCSSIASMTYVIINMTYVIFIYLSQG